MLNTPLFLGSSNLHNSGKETAEIVKTFVESEYEKYKPIQKRLFQSDLIS